MIDGRSVNKLVTNQGLLLSMAQKQYSLQQAHNKINRQLFCPCPLFGTKEPIVIPKGKEVLNVTPLIWTGGAVIC